jgi:hypothetical protein
VVPSSAAAGLADRTTKLPSSWRVHAAALTMTLTPAESSNTTIVERKRRRLAVSTRNENP